MKNGGTNYGSPMTGAGSQNCVGCTWSGTAPNFTITTTGTGITSETFPADLFNPFTCTGPTCVFGKANAAPGTILRSQAGSSYLPITQRGLPTVYFNAAGGHTWTIPLVQPASGPDLVEVSIFVSANNTAFPPTPSCTIGDNVNPTVLTITD